MSIGHNRAIVAISVLLTAAAFPSSAQANHPVTASAGLGGSISPSGTHAVDEDYTKSFTLTPDADFQVKGVGGTCPYGAFDGNTYTTGAITNDCTVVANFTLSSMPEAPTISLHSLTGGVPTLKIEPGAQGASPIESYTTTCSIDNVDERASVPPYRVDPTSGRFSASALSSPPIIELAGPQASALLARTHSDVAEAVSFIVDDTELGRLTLNMVAYAPFSSTATVYVDDEDQGADILGYRRYFRGQVEGFADSYAFVSVMPSGDVDVMYRVERGQRQGRLRSGALMVTDLDASAALQPRSFNVDDVREPERLKVPEPDERSSAFTATVAALEPGSFILAGGSGYSSIYSIEVPEGQQYVGVMSRGPGNAGVVMARDASSISAISDAAQGVCRFGIYVGRLCTWETPEAGTYYFYIYKFDSEQTEISLGYADALKPYESYRAPIAIDMDADLYGSFASDDEAVAYLAALFAYSSEVYEEEINTELQIGDVLFRTSDITSSLSSIGSYWNQNYPELERALVAHLTLNYSGGIAWKSNVSVCGREYGYSVSGVDGISPELGAPISWDATVFSHELGHNFDSPHTHEAAGLMDNPSKVDQCTSGYLPGVNSVTGGLSGEYNGTVMSYCHLRSGGLSNIASTFGEDHPYGVAPERIPANMRNTIVRQAAVAPSCVATYTSQQEWSKTVAAEPDGGATFVTFDDLAPQESYSCTAIATNGSGNSPVSGEVALTTERYQVTASAESGGSIAPVGAVTVSVGDTATFTLSPDSGYEVSGVAGTCPEGTLTGDSYTTGAINVDCTVLASFKVLTYEVTSSSLIGGSISPNGIQSVAPGATLDFSLLPDNAYEVGGVGGTCPYGSLLDNAYSTGAITADCSVIASFRLLPPTTPPSTPQITRIEGGDQEIYIYFVGILIAERYVATCVGEDGTYTSSSTSDRITVEGVSNDVSYACSVVAENVIGASEASTRVSVTPESLSSGLPIWLLYQATQ